MARKLSLLYPAPQSEITAAHPYGTFTNDLVAGDRKGTPYEREWARDMWGFLEYLLNAAGIVPDGVEESINASQYYASLVALFLQTGKDIDLEGNYFLRSQTILDTQLFQALHFDGVSGSGLVNDNGTFSDSFENGVTYICGYNAISAGESDNGRFFEKVHSLGFQDSGGNLRLEIVFSGDNGLFDIDTPVEFNKDSIIGISYVGNNVSNVPLVKIGGVPVSVTVTQAPTGTITTDVGADLYFCNRAADDLTFHGKKKSEMFLNRAMSADELKKWTSSNNNALTFADEGGSNVDLTSGTATIGKKYKTKLFIAGDDFSNIADIGASANVTGAEWTATGTTPTTWTNSSVLNQLGATLVLLPQDIISDNDGNGVTWEDSNPTKNHASLTGTKVTNRSRQLVEEFGTWNPTIGGSGTPGTYTATITENFYYKKGSECRFTAKFVNIVENVAGTNNLQIGGFPFLQHSNFRAQGNVQFDTLDVSPSAINVILSVEPGASVATINFSANNGNDGATQISGITSGVTDISLDITLIAED